VRKAIENTAASISDVPEEKLTTGHGLLQVDRLTQIIFSLLCFSETSFLTNAVDFELTSYCCCFFRAFEYARQAKKLPLVSYKISINQVGKSSKYHIFPLMFHVINLLLIFFHLVN
jgi:tripeptidyl-peptidase-2